jgi:Putative bacterial sensory transduction regulator
MANHTTVETLARFLDENSLQYELFLDEERIMLWIDGVPVIVRYRTEAAVLLITVPNVLRAPQDGHGAPGPEALDTFLRYLMDINYKLMVGRFGWDHRDGELIFEIAILCTDVDVSRDQFMANLVLAVQTVEKRYPHLQRALWAGLSLEQLLTAEEDPKLPTLPSTGHA